MQGNTPLLYTESEMTSTTLVPEAVVEVTVSTGLPVAKLKPQALHVIKQRISQWKKNKRICSVMFKKIKLKSSDYSRNHTNISKFIQLSEKGCHSADHVLAVLLNCVAYKHAWQQPMAFYFTKSAAEGPQMKAIIKKIVKAVCQTGLTPIALISNQDIAFQYAFRSLQMSTGKSQIAAGEIADGSIHLNGHCLSVIYDPLHLLRGVRNHFLTKNIELNGKTSRWHDLVEVYCTDRNPLGGCHARYLNKLVDEDIIPEKIEKKKTENCAQVFSKRVAGLIMYTTKFELGLDSNGMPKGATMANTAQLVSFLDDLFDSVTTTRQQGRYRVKRNKLRTEVSEYSEHKYFWPKAIEMIENIKFIDEHKATSARTLKNWVTTIKSFQKVFKLLRKTNIAEMYPGDFNLTAIKKWKSRYIDTLLTNSARHTALLAIRNNPSLRLSC